MTSNIKSTKSYKNTNKNSKKLTINGYTQKFEKSILKDLKESCENL